MRSKASRQIVSAGKPVLLYDFRCPGAQAYVHLASEVLKRERLLHAAPEVTS